MAWRRTEQATSHYLNQWWPSLMTHIWVTRPHWVKMTSYVFVHADKKETPKLRINGSLWGEFTIGRWFPPQRTSYAESVFIFMSNRVFVCFQGKAGVRSRESQWYRWLNVHGTLDAEKELIMYRWIGVLLYKTLRSSIWNQLYKNADLPWHMTSHSQLHQAPPWWRHQMETVSALLALCAGNSPVPVNSPLKGQCRGALMFSLICVWINGWVNNREAGDLRRRRGHYDVIVMTHGISFFQKSTHMLQYPHSKIFNSLRPSDAYMRR